MTIRLNNKGISLVESMIAVCLTAIAVMGLMPMQDMALRTASRSDYMGRAAGIMQTELELQEAFIMNAHNVVTLGALPTKALQVSDEAGVEGDATFTVDTTVSQNPTSAISWIVNVWVTWPGNATGVRSSLIVTRQSAFE